jgi:hypothetical protein
VTRHLATSPLATTDDRSLHPIETFDDLAEALPVTPAIKDR